MPLLVGHGFSQFPALTNSVQGKPPVTAGRKAKGSQLARQPGCRRLAAAPRPGKRARGLLFGSSSKSFVSLASGSRAREAEPAITPRGQPWGGFVLCATKL